MPLDVPAPLRALAADSVLSTRVAPSGGGPILRSWHREGSLRAGLARPRDEPPISQSPDKPKSN